MDIEKLFEFVKKENKIKGEKCMICHFASKKNMVKLNCNHYFHKECLGPKKKIKCLYCGKITLLKKNNEVGSINKKINKNTVKKKNSKKEIKCKAILKSGKRKGEKCGRINCGYHKNKIINV